MRKPATENVLALESKEQLASQRTAKELLSSAAPHQRALLRILVTANQHAIDPSPLLAGLADELPVRYGERVKDLGNRIAGGEEPIEAAIETPGLFTETALLALQLARSEGTLPSLIAGLESCHPRLPDADPTKESPVTVVSRLAIRVFFMAWILGFMVVFIVPEFQSMFEEFGVELPSMMKLLIVYTNRVAMYWYLLLVVMLVAVPFCIPTLLRYFKRWGPLSWRQPTFYRSANRRRELALIAQAKQPLEVGIGMLTALRPTRWNNWRFRRAGLKIEEGRDAWDSLATERIISPRDARALSLSTDKDTQAWLLRSSAHQSQKRSETRFEIVFRMMIAAIHILLALIVVFVCVAVFMTLVTLMDSIFSSQIG